MCPRNRRAPDVLRLQQRHHATRSSIARRRRAYSARGKEIVRTRAGFGHVGHLPALSSQNSQDSEVVKRPAKTRTGTLGFGRVAVPIAVGTVPEGSVSSRAISRAAFHVAMRVRREATLFWIRRSSRRSPAHVVRARQTTSTLEGRWGGHAMGRQPWSPLAGTVVFGPPSSREFPIANLEGILQGRPPRKIAQRVSGRASSKVPCPGSGATDGGRACSQVQRQRSRRRERSCGSRTQTASRGHPLRTRRANTHRLGARKRELRPETPMLAPGRRLAVADREPQPPPPTG